MGRSMYEIQIQMERELDDADSELECGWGDN